MKGILKALAPKLVSVVASSNPVAATVLKMATKKLGLPDNSTPEQIEEEIERNPEKASLISDVELQVKQMDIELETFKTQVADVQDARSKFGKDPTPKILAILAMLGFLAYIFMVTLQAPENNDDAIVNLVLGYLGGLVTGISSFYFGSSHNGNS